MIDPYHPNKCNTLVEKKDFRSISKILLHRNDVLNEITTTLLPTSIYERKIISKNAKVSNLSSNKIICIEFRTL
jgi:hypothetical protein